MKRITFRPLILLLIACTIQGIVTGATNRFGVSLSDIDSEFSFRVMCYNIHHCDPPYNTGEATDIDTIIGVIVRQNPDIVALQEVDVYTRRSGSTVHQAKEIADRLGMYYFFAPAIDYQGGKYGLAILSKYPLSENQSTELPRPDSSGERRVLARSKITISDDIVLRFGCTHLDTKAENRQAQIVKINEISLLESLPMIIAGDFNANEGSLVINQLDKVFTRTCTNCPLTSPARNPKNTIDYIAYRDTQNRLNVTTHKAVNETYASDHRPIVADFRFSILPSAVHTPQAYPLKLTGRLLTSEYPTDITIYTMLGEIVMNQSNTTSLEIPSSIGKGMYVVYTNDGAQKICIH